jgi:lipopolysaccharide/colanic/teichoic acid biosynthesis glycosyltransferase
MTIQLKADLHRGAGAREDVVFGPPTPCLECATALFGTKRAAPAPVAGPYARFGKRALDLALGTTALFLALPVLVLLALALWLESGNPFFFQRRLGKDGREFRMWKLRSMVLGADRKLAECLAADPALREEWNRTQKLKRDPRITPLGRFIRMTSLDELPQLFNVINGDMSLVGPRPMLPEQLPLYLYPEAYLALRPGITGLWQVTARNEEAFALRAVLDRDYLEGMSFRQDLRIMGATFGAVVQATGY